MDDNIQAFMEITGMSQVASMRFLSIYSYNLEEALSAHFSLHSDSLQPSAPPIVNPLPSSSPHSEDIISPTTPQDTGMISEESHTHSSQTLLDTFFSYLFSSLKYSWELLRRYALGPAKSLIFAIFKLIFYFFVSLFDASFVSTPNFTHTFEADFGTTHPKFFHGSYSMALSEAFRRKKLLLVYSHTPANPNFPNFLSGVIRNSNIISLLDQDFIVFPRVPSDGRGAEDSSAPPVLIVLLPQGAQSVRQLTSFTINTPSAKIIAGLDSILLQMNTRDHLGTSPQHYENDRRLRQQQDMEYQEALKRDAEKQKQQKEIIEKKKEAEIIIENKRKEHEMNKMLRSQIKKDIAVQRMAMADIWKEKIEKIKNALPTEKTKISIRLPSGKRISHQFLLEQKIDDIYRWVECAPYLDENLKDMYVPIEFELSAPSLNILLNQREKTIDEMGLYPNAVIYMTFLDESEDDSEDFF